MKKIKISEEGVIQIYTESNENFPFETIFDISGQQEILVNLYSDFIEQYYFIIT